MGACRVIGTFGDCCPDLGVLATVTEKTLESKVCLEPQVNSYLVSAPGLAFGEPWTLQHSCSFLGGWSQLCVHIPHRLAALLSFFTKYLADKVIFLSHTELFYSPFSAIEATKCIKEAFCREENSGKPRSCSVAAQCTVSGPNLMGASALTWT